MKKPFYVYNSLSRSVEEFHPLNPPLVTYYSCGPTVYLPQHLGNMRAYLFVDTLRRALEFNGYDVRHVMNITDVGHMTSDEDGGEDKVEKAARAEGKRPEEVADSYIAQFIRDIGRLNIKLPNAVVAQPVNPADAFARATRHIDAMIAVIGRVIDNGYAYVTPSGVYFDVEKWRGPSGRGRLSRQSLDEQRAGRRLEHSPDKRSPHDFALWVLNQPGHIMQWESPWGRGYPGWHIECSAMAMRYLGETIDIHSGGLDHIPIHHENEIAQSESATGKPFAGYFVHNAFLVGMEGAKISKSAGRFPVLDDLAAAGVDPLAFRLFCFGAKYRSELVFSLEAVRAAQSNLGYFYEFARNVPETAAKESDNGWSSAYAERFEEALYNDLNTPQALAVALELVAESYRRKDWSAWRALLEFDRVLGLNLNLYSWLVHRAELPSEVSRLITERDAARKNRDFKRADELRRQIESLGIVVKDQPGGVSVYGLGTIILGEENQD